MGKKQHNLCKLSTSVIKPNANQNHNERFSSQNNYYKHKYNNAAQSVEKKETLHTFG